jgi:glucosamine-6-phosphate deaminase
MIKELKADDLAVKIYPGRTEMGNAAAGMVSSTITHLLNGQEFVNMIFAAAPSQKEFLAVLIEREDVDWTRVNAFHMDEYIGLPDNHPALFSSFLREKIFEKVPFHTVNYINGNAPDIPAECERYADLLLRYSTDIVCMGIGENGHIAFNDPHVADFNDPESVKIVDLDRDCRLQQVNDGCFSVLDKVPTHALTLTIPALMAGKYIYCMVPGKNKAEAVQHTLLAEIKEQYPASILRRHSNAILFLDGDSCSLINTKFD